MKRKAYVDLAKFIAIFVVLMNHIDLKLPFINSFGGLFYVPIFFFLAGYTYHEKEETYRSFAVKKVKRLLVPYLTANLFLFLFFFVKDSLLPGRITAESFRPLIGIIYSRNSLYPPQPGPNVYFLTILNSPTWFLTALFLTYLLFEAVVRIAKRFRGRQAETLSLCVSGCVLLIVGVVLHYVCKILLPWSLDCIPFFVLYMLAGYFVQRHEFEKKIAKNPAVFVVMALLTFAGYKLCGSANISIGDFGDYTVIGVFNGILSSLLILMICYNIHQPEFLCKIGRNTLHILCYHMFVFVNLVYACNLVLPGKFAGGGAFVYLLKFAVIIVTIAVIQTVDKLWKTTAHRIMKK